MYTHDMLATYVELISDDFESTFSVISDNVLSNMLGHRGDKEHLMDIIKNYLPDADIQFEKTGQFPGQYDIYLIVNKITPK